MTKKLRVIFFIVLFVGVPFAVLRLIGIGGWGPVKEIEATVTSTYVDRSDDDSHYMVSTDQGVFEVNNGWLLRMWNADEVFGQIQEGNTYRLRVRGKRRVNFAMQYYPYILEATPLLAASPNPELDQEGFDYILEHDVWVNWTTREIISGDSFDVPAAELPRTSELP